jgi:hypothetical protein
MATSSSFAAADDTALAVVPRLVKIAGGLLFATSGIAAIHVMQLFGLIVRYSGVIGVLLGAMAIEALAGMVAGMGLARARTWAPWAAIVAAALLWVTSVIWFGFAMANGVFTLFGFLVPGIGFLALVLAFFARKPCDIAAAARKRLGEQGLDLGL